MSKRSTAVLVGSAVLAVDQVSKWWALGALSEGPLPLVGDWLQLELTRNSGAAFGLFKDGGVVFGLAAIFAVGLVVTALGSATSRLEVVGLGLILGGALGNLTDRLFRGAGTLDGLVIDFIRLPNWPNFNAADSAITVGASLLLLSTLRQSR